MKLSDILSPEKEQLDEINLKQALAGAAIGATAMLPISTQHRAPPQPQAATQSASKSDYLSTARRALDSAASKYSVDPALFDRIVKAAHKHAHADFPKAEDIIAIAAVESGFRPSVKSNLKRDPALGLMQIRPGVWNIPPHKLMSVEDNIMYGSKILRKYYERLKDKDAAVQAYNVGITAYRKGKKNERYLQKYKTEKQNIAAKKDM